MGHVVITTKEEFDKQIQLGKDKSQPVFVDFTATWCGPCKMIKPLFKTLSTENAEKAIFLEVDVDGVQAVAEAAGITAMPTFHVYVDGKKVDELVGASQDKLKALVAKHLATA